MEVVFFSTRVLCGKGFHLIKSKNSAYYIVNWNAIFHKRKHNFFIETKY